jgi:hypothetical protein
MRKRELIAAAALAVVTAGVVALWPEPSSRITRENVDRIREGMTRDANLTPFPVSDSAQDQVREAVAETTSRLSRRLPENHP